MVSNPARDTARNLSSEATYNDLPDEADFWGSVAESFNKKEKALSIDVIEIAIHEAMKKIEEYGNAYGVG